MNRSPRKLLLALDTSTRIVGLALYDGSEVLCESAWSSQDHHTIELAPAVDEILRRTSSTTSELAAVAVALGPGSFTGLRIGLALAKGLALACHVPLIGIPTLNFLAAAQPAQQLPMAALLRAGRGRLATGWYRYIAGGWQSYGRVEVLTLEDLTQRITAPTWVCGELNSNERATLQKDCPDAILASPAFSFRRTAFLAELAWKEWQAGNYSNPETLTPIYLHYNEPIPE